MSDLVDGWRGGRHARARRLACGCSRERTMTVGCAAEPRVQPCVSQSHGLCAPIVTCDQNATAHGGLRQSRAPARARGRPGANGRLRLAAHSSMSAFCRSSCRWNLVPSTCDVAPKKRSITVRACISCCSFFASLSTGHWRQLSICRIDAYGISRPFQKATAREPSWREILSRLSPQSRTGR